MWVASEGWLVSHIGHITKNCEIWAANRYETINTGDVNTALSGGWSAFRGSSPRACVRVSVVTRAQGHFDKDGVDHPRYPHKAVLCNQQFPALCEWPLNLENTHSLDAPGFVQGHSFAVTLMAHISHPFFPSSCCKLCTCRYLYHCF